MSAVYFLALIMIYFALKRLKFFGNSHEQPQISVVIAARNEQGRIEPCLSSLEKLIYPIDKYEIILVDDCSDDQTASEMEKYASGKSNWRVIKLTRKSKQLRGKKNALLAGISESTGEIIFTTDADCMVPPNWLRGMIRMFEPNVAMVLGYSPLVEFKGVLQRILKFDNMFSAIASAAPTKLGYPFTSVGRNLAYRKKAYQDAGGFLALKKFKSGDDIHLTERFRYLGAGKIEYCANPDTFVNTQPPVTIGEIFHQQIRKNSKILLSTPSSILMAVLIFFYYLMTAIFPFVFPQIVITWLTVIVLKILLELIALDLANKLFRQNFSVYTILMFQLVYPLHIIFFSLLGLFQVYKWKR
jgi:cellulose synthase/poly-beta-1,6-N-acetylglucosamine synthase-like glycosyltransferase